MKKDIGRGDPIYSSRNRNLEIIGFDSYRSYLNSELWKGIRRRVFARSKECCVCNAVATEIHHINYRTKTLLGNDISALIPLCQRCHRSIEFDDEGNKRSGVKARNESQRILAKWFRKRARYRRKAGILKPRDRRRIAVVAEQRERERWTQIRIDKGLRKAGEY